MNSTFDTSLNKDELISQTLRDKDEVIKEYKEMVDILVSNLNTVIATYNDLKGLTDEATQGYETAVMLAKKSIELCRTAVLNPSVEQESRLIRLTDMLGYAEELKVAHSSIQKELAYFSDKLPSI